MSLWAGQGVACAFSQSTYVGFAAAQPQGGSAPLDEAARAALAAILNAGYAMEQGIDGVVIMGTEDVLSVHRAASETLLIASHVEGINLRSDTCGAARVRGG